MNGATVGTISVALDNSNLGTILKTEIERLAGLLEYCDEDTEWLISFRREILEEILSCWKAGQLPAREVVLANPEKFLRQRCWEILYDEALIAVAKDLEHGDMTALFRRAWTDTAAWLATDKWPEETEEGDRS